MSKYVMTSTGGLPEVPQLAAAAALVGTPAHYLSANARFYRRQRDTLLHWCQQANERLLGYSPAGAPPIRVPVVPKAGFFACLDFAALRGLVDFDDRVIDDDFALFRYFLTEAHVSVVPLSTVGFAPEDMVVRITFAVDDLTLQRACAAIEDAVARLLRRQHGDTDARAA